MISKKSMGGLSDPYQAHRGLVLSNQGLVCSAHPLASGTGAAILRRGGNFIDAALATSAVLNVVEPYNSHLGGDAFALVYSDGCLETLNSSGPSPASIRYEDFRQGIPTTGVNSVTVPGQVGAWDALHQNYSTMSWGEILAPAINYAKNGFPMNPRLVDALKSSWSNRVEDKGWREVFARGKGKPQIGDILTQPDLARTILRISEVGPRDFYSGKLASKIVDYLRGEGSSIQEEDFSSFEPEFLAPIKTSYRGYTVYEQPPVSQGHILLEELNIVEGYDLSSLPPDGTEAVHLMVEAKKIAFQDRYGHSGDPEFVDLPIEDLISKTNAKTRRKLIDPRKASAGYQLPSLKGGNTTYFTVADGEGNAVSFIQSLFHHFGSRVLVPGTGIILNNRMNGFSLDRSSPNVLVPGKRPIHTLNTYMIFNGNEPLFVGGTPGGDKQVQTNLQVITRLIDWRMNVQRAVEFPRWASGDGLDLEMENRYPPETVEKLRSYGHRVNAIGPWSGSGSVQLIMTHPENGSLIGGSDPRCDGMAVGI